MGLIDVLVVCSSVLSVLINKYFLSVVLFTYPAVFQGLQCAFVIVFLVIVGTSVDVHVSLPAIHDIAYCLPSATAFSLALYSGSCALQQLSVSVHCSLASITDTVVASSGAFLLGKSSVKWMLLLMTLQLLSLFQMIYNALDMNVLWNGYLWMGIFCVSTCVACFLKKLAPDFEDGDTTLVNHVISCILLLLYGIVTKQVFAAWSFANTRSRWFYIGLGGSGLVCGMAATAKLKMPKQSLTLTVAKIRIVGSVLGLYLFDKDAISVVQQVWILISFVCFLALALLANKDAN
jgi:hypothetical protein